MNYPKSLFQANLRQCVTSVVLLMIACSTTITIGQDQVDHVRRYPVEFSGEQSTGLALKQIDWLLARTGMTRQRLEEHEVHSQAWIKKLLEERATLAESLPLEFRFADDRARSEAVSKCLQELLAVRLELATQSAMLENKKPDELEEKLEALYENRTKLKNLDGTLSATKLRLEQTQQQFLAGDATQVELDVVSRENQQLEAEYSKAYETAVRLTQELAATGNPDDLQYLPWRIDNQKRELQVRVKQAAVDQAEKALQYSTKLFEKNMVSREQLDKDEFALENARLALESAKMTYSIEMLGVETQASREQTRINREIRVLQAREEAAKSFLEQLNSAALSNQQIRRLDEEIDVKRREKELLQNQQFELQHEIDELEILQTQVKQDLEKFLAAEVAAKENKDPADKD